MLNHNQCKIIWNTTANSILRNECFPARVSCCAQDSMNLTLTWISGFLRFLHLIFLHLELRPVFVSLRWVQTRKPRSRLGGHVDIFLVWVFIAVVERWFYQSINNSINQLINQQINQSNLIQANQNQMKSIQSNQIKSKSNQSNQSTYQSVNPSLIHSFIHSFTHSLIYSLNHSLLPLMYHVLVWCWSSLLCSHGHAGQNERSCMSNSCKLNILKYLILTFLSSMQATLENVLCQGQFAD